MMIDGPWEWCCLGESRGRVESICLCETDSRSIIPQSTSNEYLPTTPYSGMIYPPTGLITPSTWLLYPICSLLIGFEGHIPCRIRLCLRRLARSSITSERKEIPFPINVREGGQGMPSVCRRVGGVERD